MAAKRKIHTPAFKAQVALAAHRGDRTVNELAGHYGVHPTLIHAWKKQLLTGAEGVFTDGVRAVSADAVAREAELYEQIGRLKMELEWMKKKLPPSAERKRPLIEVDHHELSVRRQCALLGLNRSSLYYEPTSETPEALRPMRLIDEQYAACPFYGSRRMTALRRGLSRYFALYNGQRVHQSLGYRTPAAVYQTQVPRRCPGAIPDGGSGIT